MLFGNNGPFMVVVSHELELVGVEVGVMRTTEQRKVGEVRLSAVIKVVDVMHLTSFM